MTIQEAYNKAYIWFVVDGNPISIDEITGACKYRLALDDGTILRCGVGILIPDEAYESIFDRQEWDISLLFENRPGILKEMGFTEDESLVLSFLKSLQAAHDSHQDVRGESFIKDFEAVGHMFDLSIPLPT